MNREAKAHALDSEIDKAKICLETARIPWRSLQRFFAAGKVYQVSRDLDLTEVVLRISRDDSPYVEQLLKEGELLTITDEQALHWYDQDSELWAVVVKPFVLVQAVT